jgi:fatty acid desaturase
LNTLLALPPLSLWLPFEAYRQSHLAHHETERLTDPEHDPESRYPLQGPGAGRSLARAAALVQSTLLGRMILGPAFEVIGFLNKEATRLARRDPARLRLWTVHTAMAGAVLAWLGVVCHLSLTQYLMCFVYPGCALSLVRSFAEHRADPDPAHRVAVVENAPALGLLFLNNNLHAAHHERPGLPWHRLPQFYARERERILAANGGLVYSGYGEVFARYLWRSHHVGPAPSGSSRGQA